MAFFHKALHIIQLSNEVLVQCEKNGGWRSVFDFGGENLTVLCYFYSGFYTIRRQIDGKIRYVAIFFLFEKKYVVNAYKGWFHLVVFLYWYTTASLGPRFLKMFCFVLRDICFVSSTEQTCPVGRSTNRTQVLCEVLHPTLSRKTRGIDHNTGNYVPYSFRWVCGFFNVPC